MNGLVPLTNGFDPNVVWDIRGVVFPSVAILIVRPRRVPPARSVVGDAGSSRIVRYRWPAPRPEVGQVRSRDLAELGQCTTVQRRPRDVSDQRHEAADEEEHHEGRPASPCLARLALQASRAIDAGMPSSVVAPSTVTMKNVMP